MLIGTVRNVGYRFVLPSDTRTPTNPPPKRPADAHADVDVDGPAATVGCAVTEPRSTCGHRLVGAAEAAEVLTSTRQPRVPTARASR